MLGTIIPQTRPTPTLSFPSLPNAKIRRNFRNSSTPNLRLRASSLSDPNFPLGSKIMVRNLGYSISESSLQKEFSDFGEVAEVKLVKGEAVKRSYAYAFIQYTRQDDAILALEIMDRKIFDGRMIYVELAKPGKRSFGGYPIASGPPKKQDLQEQDEIADCWY